MRFETKYDLWMVAILVVAGVFTCIALPLMVFVTPGPNSPPLSLAFPAPAIFLIAISCSLPQYYEVRESGLFLRQGWRKSLVPFASLAELQSISSSRSAAVFSTDRILVVTKDGKRFLIAVAEEARFLAEVSKRSPQLERRSFGLGLPLAPPSVV